MSSLILIATLLAPLVGETRSASSESELYELTLRWSEGEAVELFLADPETNAPIGGAAIELRWSGPADVRATAAVTPEPGIYTSTLSGPAGVYALTAIITAAQKSDLLTLSVDRTAPAPPAPAAPQDQQPWLWIALGIAALVIIAATSFLAGRASRRGDAALALLLAVALPLASTRALAHGGEDHGEPVGVVVVSDVRFIPKELQFMLGVRTARATSEPMTERIRVPGSVVAPPDASAQVRAPRAGRLELPDSGRFPTLGERVVAGQVLATFVDLPDGTDLATLAAEHARARGTSEQSSARLVALRAELRRKEEVPEVVSVRELEDLKSQIRVLDAELRASRAATTALGPASLRIQLVAPIDGVVATIGDGLGVGGIVTDASALFTIVAPERLQIAARVFEQQVRGVVPDVDATVLGVGRASWLSSAPIVDAATRSVELRYAVTATNLRLGQYVEVDVPVGPPIEVVAIPASAIDEVDGRPVVYLKTGAETFAPRAVVVVRRDGDRVGVRGIAAGDRVVVSGASFVALAGPP